MQSPKRGGNIYCRRRQCLGGSSGFSGNGSFTLLEAAYLAAELGLRGADSTYVAVAARLDLPLVTLDIDQKERSGKRIKVIEISR